MPCPALPCPDLPCLALPLHFNIFPADYHHANLTAKISTFTQHFPAIVHGQPTFEHLLFRITPWWMNSLNSNISRHITACYMKNLHLNIYYAYRLHAAWTAFHSKLISKFPQCYLDSLHFNIYTSHSRNAKWSPHISTSTLQIHSVLHGQPTFQHLLFRFLACYMDSLHLQI